VPAIIFTPSESIAFANCLASLSVANVLVCLAWVVKRRSFGDSTETNHRLVTAPRAKMDVPWLLLNSAKILGCRLDRALISIKNVPCAGDVRSRPLRQLRCHRLLRRCPAQRHTHLASIIHCSQPTKHSPSEWADQLRTRRRRQNRRSGEV
jgi:hypothetical protein